MTTAWKLPSNTAAYIASVTPSQAHILYDTTNNRVMFGDGATLGGVALSKAGHTHTGTDFTGSAPIIFDNGTPAAPAISGGRSTGARLVIYDRYNATDGTADYAIGMASYALWFGVAKAASNYSFKWYAGETQIAKLSGDGTLALNATPRVGVNEVWHEGNDGAGSGLDADLLKGVNIPGPYRSDTEAADRKVPIGGVYLTTAGTYAVRLPGSSGSGVPVTPSYYVSPRGSDSADGLTAGTAWKTVAHALANANTDTNVLLERGGLWREYGLYIPRRLTLGAYGAGGKPVITASTAITSDWELADTNIWSTPLAVTPDLVATYRDWTSDPVSGVVRLSKNVATPTKPEAGQWGYSSGTLYVYATVDPNTANYEYAQGTANNSGTIMTAAASGCVVEGITFALAKRNCFLFGQGINGGTIRRCLALGAFNDGIDGDAGDVPPVNILVEDCIISDCGDGVSAPGSGASGDGISFHSTHATNKFSVTITGCTIRNCQKSGIGHQFAGDCTAFGNRIINCYNGIAFFSVSNFTAACVQKYHYNLIVCDKAWNKRGINHASASLMTGSGVKEIEIYNNTLIGYKDGIVGTEAIYLCDTPPTVYVHWRVDNNIIFNWPKALAWGGVTPPVVESMRNNCIYLCSVQYSGSGLSGYSVAPITTSPKFIDANKANYGLNLDSSCLGAGVNHGFTFDLAGTEVGSPPDVGCFERA